MTRRDSIFIHIPKTGGISIKNYLRNYLFLDSLRKSHAPYKDYVATLGSSIVDYYSFAFVRNPWDRLVSSFFFLQEYRNQCDFSFSFFVKSSLKHSRAHNPYYFPQTDFLQPASGISFIGRFEQFARDFEIVCNHLNVDYQELPISNPSNHEHYTHYYDNETRDIVARIYFRDIKSFGYEFGK